MFLSRFADRNSVEFLGSEGNIVCYIFSMIHLIPWLFQLISHVFLLEFPVVSFLFPDWIFVLRFFKKLKIELPYNPAIPLLGIYPEKTIIWKDTCTPMFIAALFTIAKTWKPPKCPLTDEWTRKMWKIYIDRYIYIYWILYYIYIIYIYMNITQP